MENIQQRAKEFVKNNEVKLRAGLAMLLFAGMVTMGCDGSDGNPNNNSTQLQPQLLGCIENYSQGESVGNIAVRLGAGVSGNNGFVTVDRFNDGTVDYQGAAVNAPSLQLNWVYDASGNLVSIADKVCAYK